MGKIDVITEDSVELCSKGYSRKVSSYKNGVLHGEMTKWYLNGNIAMRTYYRDGTKCGKQFHWDKKGRLVSVYSYKNDIPNGKFRIWDKKCEIKTIGYMKNGKRHGYVKSFRNGILRGRTGYKNGRLHGKDYEYYLTGTLINEFTNGKMTGYDGQQLWNESKRAAGTKWAFNYGTTSGVEYDSDEY